MGGPCAPDLSLGNRILVELRGLRIRDGCSGRCRTGSLVPLADCTFSAVLALQRALQQVHQARTHTKSCTDTVFPSGLMFAATALKPVANASARITKALAVMPERLTTTILFEMCTAVQEGALGPAQPHLGQRLMLEKTLQMWPVNSIQLACRRKAQALSRQGSPWRLKIWLPRWQRPPTSPCSSGWTSPG